MSKRPEASSLRRLLALSVAILALAAVLAATRSGHLSPPPPPGSAGAVAPGDRFAYVAGRDGRYVARATAGSGQVLFTKSPGGALATAARVAALRGLIDAATRGSGIDPSLVEGIVFVESAGRPYALAGNDLSAAAGLTQILAGTGISLLGMHIDLATDRRLLAALSAATSSTRQRQLIGRLAQADDRFDPRRALGATVHYLQLASRRFGRSDLAVVSYHMGIGNLGNVLGTYDGGRSVPYAQLFFDTAPDRHAATFKLLSGFGDQSSLYLWRVLGAVQVMRLYRADRPALQRLSSLQTALDSSAEVLHPPDRTRSFTDPAALSAGYADRSLVPLPRNLTALGLRASASLGVGGAAGVPRALYRGLAPSALKLLVELAARVRALSGSASPLTVVRTVADRQLLARQGELDPTVASGYAFSLLRRYASPVQAQALQTVLDRLQALDLVSWARRGPTISVTVAGDASRVITSGV